MKKRIFLIFLSISLLFMLGIAVSAATAANFTYSVNSDGVSVTITGYTGEQSGDLVIPDTLDGYTVTAIGDSAFYHNFGFTGTLKLPENLTLIGNYAFLGCRFTGELILPSTLYSIGTSAFEDCKWFTDSLVIPDSVISIERKAFWRCSGFTGSLKLSNNLTSIGNNAFEYCNGLTGDLIIPDSLTTIAPYAFAYCSQMNGSLVIPDTVTSIGTAAFQGCRSLTGTLTLPPNLTEITAYTFSQCAGFTGELQLPKNITKLGSGVFNGCSGLSGQVVLPATITSLGGYVFENCSSIESFTFKSTLPPTLYTNDFKNTTALSAVYVPAESYAAYVAALTGYIDAVLIVPNEKPTGDFSYTVNADGITAAITGYTGEQSGDLVIPDTIDGYTVTAIGYRAFYNCTGFTGTLTIPNSVVSIEKEAFWKCSGFTGSLTIPDSVTSIGDHAFFQCNGFSGSLIIPDNVTSIGSNAFYQCSGFGGSLIIPDSVTSIGTLAFSACYSIDQILFRGNAPSINSDAFRLLTATVYYPANNSTWTSSIMQNYGGKLTWQAYGFPGSKIIAARSSVPKNCEFTADISFEYTQPTTSFAFYNFSADPKYAEIISAEWLLDDAVIANVDLANHAAAIAFDGAVDANQAVLRLYLRPADVVQDTNVTIRCSAVMEISNETVSLPVESCSVTILNSLSGDANSDGMLNIADALYLLRRTLLPARYPLPYDETEFDFSKDGILNADDAVHLLAHISSPDQYPIN